GRPAYLAAIEHGLDPRRTIGVDPLGVAHLAPGAQADRPGVSRPAGGTEHEPRRRLAAIAPFPVDPGAGRRRVRALAAPGCAGAPRPAGGRQREPRRRLVVIAPFAVGRGAGRRAVRAVAGLGCAVTVTADGPAPVAQRMGAAMVNVASMAAEKGLAVPEDIDR